MGAEREVEAALARAAGEGMLGWTIHNCVGWLNGMEISEWTGERGQGFGSG